MSSKFKIKLELDRNKGCVVDSEWECQECGDKGKGEAPVHEHGCSKKKE